MNIPEEFILKQMLVGPLDNFLYFVGDARTREIALIDPAWDIPYLCEEAKKNEYTIKSIFLTHGHHDHVNGLDEILEKYNVPAYISVHEADFYKPKHKNIVEIENTQKLKLGNIEFEIIHTPGHTPGSICFKYKDILLTGDAIFIDGCGRCDLPGGDAKAMYHTLYDTLMQLPDSTMLFTGHNYGPTP